MKGLQLRSHSLCRGMYWHWVRTSENVTTTPRDNQSLLPYVPVRRRLVPLSRRLPSVARAPVRPTRPQSAAADHG